MPATDSTAAIEAVYRIEFPRVVATLARSVGDIGLAEDLAQEALVDALRQWPRDGTPANPGAWLTAVGKRKAIDLFRRDRTLAAKYAQVGRALESEGPAGVEALADVESDGGDPRRPTPSHLRRRAIRSCPCRRGSRSPCASSGA